MNHTDTQSPEEQEYIMLFLKEQKSRYLSQIMADINKTKHYVINKVYAIASENGYKVKNLYSKNIADPILIPKKVSDKPIVSIPRGPEKEPSRISNDRFKCLILNGGVQVSIVVSAPSEEKAIDQAKKTSKGCEVLSVQKINRKPRK